MHMLCEEKTVRELFEGLEDGFIYSLFLAGVGMPNEGLTITAMEGDMSTLFRTIF